MVERSLKLKTMDYQVMSERQWFLADFAIETITLIADYATVVSCIQSLVAEPNAPDWQERINAIRAVCWRSLTPIAHRLVVFRELEPTAAHDNDVRDASSIRDLADAVVSGLVVVLAAETPQALRDVVVLSPATIRGLLDEQATEIQLAHAFRQQTGGELGRWPNWADLSTDDS